jgi:hypothetical protein
VCSVSGLAKSLNMTLTLSRFVRRPNNGVLCFIVSDVAIYVNVTGQRHRQTRFSSPTFLIFEVANLLVSAFYIQTSCALLQIRISIPTSFCITTHPWLSQQNKKKRRYTIDEDKNSPFEVRHEELVKIGNEINLCTVSQSISVH